MFRQASAYIAILIVVLLAAVTIRATSAADDQAAPAEGPVGLATCPMEEGEGEAEECGAEQAAPAPATFTVEATALKIEQSFDGVFEAGQMFPVSIVPEVWGSLEVLRAVPAGTVVKKGDPILWLDTEDIDRQIAETIAGEKLAELQIAQAEAELAFAEQSYDRNLAWARRAGKIVEEDHLQWLATTEEFRDRYQPLNREVIDLRHESSEEELRQLKEMYEADELIEATEEMILKRNEYSAKRGRIDYDVQLLNYDFHLDYQVDRSREQHARGIEDAEISLERTELMMPLQLAIKQEQRAKARRDRERSLEKFAQLQADRELMVVNAPADGVVYYGECVRGQWTSGGGMENKLREGGRIGSREVFMTIVQADALMVRSGMGEGNLYEIAAGGAVTVEPTGYPDEELTGRVSEVIIAPSLAAKYSFLVSLNGSETQVLPGMTCKLQVVVVDKADALMAPAAAVGSEEDDLDSKFVYVVVEGEEPVKRAVEVGRSKGDKVEITEGIAAGDVILAEKPAEEDCAE